MPFTAMANSATMAPRIEIYTMLACRVHKPDVFKRNFPRLDWDLNMSDRNDASIPSVTPEVYGVSVSAQILPQPFAASQDNGTQTPPERNTCASDPVVQAAVAKLTAGESG